MASIFETLDSRYGPDGVEKSSRTAVYLIYDAANETEARALAATTIPATLESLIFTDYDLKPLGNGIFSVEAHFDSKGPREKEEPQKQEGEQSFSFETTGGTGKVNYSRLTRDTYITAADAAAGKVAPNFKQGINVTKTSIEGVDVSVPTFSCTVTKIVPAAEMTGEYVRRLFSLTGAVNSKRFTLSVDGTDFVFLIGECRFDGAKGAKRGLETWELTYSFSCSADVDATRDPATAINVGDIVVTRKRGWDYMWVSYEESNDAVANTLVQRPKAVYIEQVYPYLDLNLLTLD